MHCFHDEVPRILDVRVFNVEHAMPCGGSGLESTEELMRAAVEKLAIDEGPLANLVVAIYEG